LSDAFDPKRNAFAFLRCALAALVIISHCYRLGGFGVDPLEAITRHGQTLGTFAVAMFFVLSGFLIARAAANSPSVGRFVWHRLLRIFPGYWACLIVCGFVIAPLVCRFEHGVILPLFSTVDAPQKFVGDNLLLFHTTAPSLFGVMNIRPHSIGGLFRANPYPYAFNGSLWTLPFEWLCYLVVAAVAALRLLSLRRRLLLAVFAILWTLNAFNWVSPSEFKRCFPYGLFAELIMLSIYFAAGSLCYLYRQEILFRRGLLVAAVAALVASPAMGCFGLIAPVAVPYAFMWLACKLPFRRFDARGDFSYGLYIYAFPLQQVLALLHLQAGGLGLFTVTSFLLTTIMAVLSYKLVEAPCLRLKKMRLPLTRPVIQTTQTALPVLGPKLKHADPLY
jgi:peptidoglycan/LPS O-acetylase OafA/YrhL